MATKKFLFSIDLMKNQILNGVLQNLAVAPSDPFDGQIYYDTVIPAPRVYNGTIWENLNGDIKGFTDTSIVTITVANGLATITVAKATTGEDGLMSKEDKVILNALEADSTLADHVGDTNDPHNVTKAQVDLGSADNTSDADKPISDDTQTALDLKASKTYVDGLVDATLKAPEAYDPAETDAYPTEYDNNPIQKGDSFRMTAAATMGTRLVNVEDLLIAIKDGAQDVDGDWMVAESNRDLATETVMGFARFANASEASVGANPSVMISPVDLKNKIDALTYPVKKVYEITGDGTQSQYEFNHALGTYEIQVTVMADTGSLAPYPVEVYWQPKATVTLQWIQVFFGANIPNGYKYKIIIIG